MLRPLEGVLLGRVGEVVEVLEAQDPSVNPASRPAEGVLQDRTSTGRLFRTIPLQGIYYELVHTVSDKFCHKALYFNGLLFSGRKLCNGKLLMRKAQSLRVRTSP